MYVRFHHKPIYVAIEYKLPINWTKGQPDFCQLKYLIKCTVALIQQVDSIEQCSDV